MAGRSPAKLLVAVPLLLALLAFAPAARGPAPRTHVSSAPIEAIAMDGARLVYAAPDGGGCERIWVWDVVTGKQTRGNSPTACHESYFWLRALAVDRDRIAWIVRSCGNSECDDTLYSSSSAATTERTLATAQRFGDGCSASDCKDGSWIAGLIGSGDVLAVSRWLEDANGAVTRAGLDVLGPHGLHRIVAGGQGIVAWAVDSARIAVLRPAGQIEGNGTLYRYAGSSVGIYSSTGRLLRTITPSSVKDVALRGDWLLVLTQTGTLDAYSVRTGARLHSWKVRAGATQLDSYGGVAVYLDQRSAAYWVHAVRLSTGKDVIVGRGTGLSYIRVIALEAPGLAYVQDVHHIVFAPLARVLADVGAPPQAA